MPNHVTNLLTFNCSDEEFEKILEFVKSPEDDKQTFDFNRMIPKPKELDIDVDSISRQGLEMYRMFLVDYMRKYSLFEVDIKDISAESEKEYIDNLPSSVKEDANFQQMWDVGKQESINIQNYKYPTWYEWSISNWNTKWNAYDIYIMNDSHSIEFLTANAAPYQVIEKLSEDFPNTEIKHEWADEFFGNTCGKCIFKHGECIEEFIPDFGKDQAKIYCKMHGLDLGEFLKETFNDTTVYSNQMLEKYPPDSRIEVTKTIMDNEVVEAGARGTVIAVDDTGTIFVKLDNDRMFGLIPGEDSFRALSEEEVLSEQISDEEPLDIKADITNRLIEFAKDFDPYDYDDNYYGVDMETIFAQTREGLDTPEGINTIKEELKIMLDHTEDKDIIERGKNLIKDLENVSCETLTDNLEKDKENKHELEKEKLNNDVLEVAKNFQRNPEDITEFLEFQSRFYNYSIRNQMLIYKQNPNATFCASYNQLKKNGHFVRKGEHGMRILVPVKKTYLQLENGKTVELHKATKEQKRAYRCGDLKAKSYKFYRPGTVFDIAQTNIKPEELPKLIDVGYKSEQHAELFKILKNYCETELKCPVKEDAFSSVSVRGEYDATNHEIRISSNFDDTTKLSILSHEMGHCMMHNLSTEAIKERARCQIEFEADALSIMLSKKMGVEIPNSRQTHVSECLESITKLRDYKPEMITESLKRANNAYSNVIKVVGETLEQGQEYTNTQDTQTQRNTPSLSNEINVQSVGAMGGLSPA